MRDVARAAGVSQTAVSFVLNNRTDMAIADETRERIWRAIDTLGYRPNAIAQGLRSGTSRLLGFVTDEIATTPFAGDIIRGAQDAAWGYGRILTLVNTDRHADLETEAVAALVQHQVEGILFATMYHREIELPASVGHLPVALVNCFSAGTPRPAAVPDEEQGGHTATRHLVERGHRHIVFLNNDDDIPATFGRRAGHERALREAGLPIDPAAEVRKPSTQEGGFDGTMEVMARPQRPTALFCFNDRMAMGAYAALQSLGLRIPDDVSVIGFDNQELIAAHLRPTLTTVALPHRDLGRWGVEALMGGGTITAKALLQCPLVERQSVAPPRQRDDDR